MVQEIPRKSECDAQESRSLNISSNDTSIWPCCKAEADKQRDLLNRYTTQDTGKLQLPNLSDLSLQNSSKNTNLVDVLQSLKAPDNVVRTAESQDYKQQHNQTHEKANANGSRMLLNDDNTIARLTRKDGSGVELNYDKGEKKQIIETNKDGTGRTIFTQNAKGLWDSNTQIKDKNGKWVSDGKGGEQYRDIAIDDQGITTKTDLVGMQHVTTADGTRLNEGARYTFDEKGRIDSISYEPGANRILKFRYDANDKLNRVDILNAEGKLQETRTKTGEGAWNVTKRNGTSGGTWQGDMELTPDGNFRQRDAKDKAAGQWQVITPFEQYAEKVSSDGKHISRVFNDKTEIQLEKPSSGEERVTKIIRGKESRELHYDNTGNISEVIDSTAKGTQSLKADGGMKASMDPLGNVTFEKPDGSIIVKKFDFNTEERDKDGTIRKAFTIDGASRSFEYETVNNHKQIVKIVDTHPGKNGDVTEVWTQKKNSDGSLSGQFIIKGSDGKESTATGVLHLYSGDFKYKGSDGKERIARMGSDSSNRESAFSAGVDDARERLKAALDGQLDARRKSRIEGFMKELETRAHDAVERQTAAGENPGKATEKWEKKIAQTYDNLAQMMEGNPSTAVYDKTMRARLVENFMWLVGDTTRGAQDVGNCWEMSGRNFTGMQNNPEAMSRMLKEVSLTGTFTAVHGGIKSRDSLDRRHGNLDGPKKFTIPKNMLQVDRVNAGWSLDKPDDCYWQGGIGTMRSTPVGYILDNVLGYMGGRRSHAALDGGTWESFNSPGGHTREGWYYGINELMYMATGEKTAKPVRVSSNNISEGDISRLTDKRLQKQLLEHGGALLVGPGHMFAVKLVKNGAHWQIVADNQWGKGGDQVLGTVTDLRSWNVQRTRTRYKSTHIV